MIRITRVADYGIVLMTHMATVGSGRVLTARDLAADSHLPLPMVSKILKRLAKAELLVSHRGVKGGYSLAREPHAISVAAIIVALDGPISMTPCVVAGPGDCEQERICPARGHWQWINRVIHGALESVTLAEIMQPVACSLVPYKKSSASAGNGCKPLQHAHVQHEGSGSW